MKPLRSPQKWHATPARRICRICIAATFALPGILGVQNARAEPIRIYAAASLKAAIPALIKASGIPSPRFEAPVFGAAGVLREQIAKGAKADIFLSGDMVEPHQLARARQILLIVPFARNRMCIVAEPSLALMTTNILEKILSPTVRLATATVGFGPGGTYALAVFDRAEKIRPGARRILSTKALQLTGSPHAIAPIGNHSPAATIFLTHRADALLNYCSAEPQLLKEVPGLMSARLPNSLEVHPLYGLALLSRNPDASLFGLFLLSERGQRILAGFGFLPLAS